MKSFFYQILVILVISTLLLSCKSQQTSIELLPDSKSVSGDLEGYLQISEGKYKVERSDNNLALALKLTVVKSLPAGKDVSEIFAKILDENGLPIMGVEKFAIYGSSNDDLINLQNALKKGNGTVPILLIYTGGKIDEAFKLIAKKGKKFSVFSKIEEEYTTDFGSEDNTKSYPDPIQTENIVKVIRQHYYRINDLVKQIQPVRENISNGYFNAYILDGNLIRADVFYNNGQPTEHYYFNDNELIFMYNDGSQVNRYYFNNDLMIRWLDPAKNEVPRNNPNYAKMERLLLENAENIKEILGIETGEVDLPPESDFNLSNEQNLSESPECDKFLKEYREFADNYVKMIIKYKNNPNDLTIINEYTKMVEKAARLDQMAMNMKDKCNHPKYWKELNEIQNKIYTTLKKHNLLQ